MLIKITKISFQNTNLLFPNNNLLFPNTNLLFLNTWLLLPAVEGVGGHIAILNIALIV